MSDPCLLTASLLTVGPIAVPPPLKLPANLSNTLYALFTSTAAQTLQSIATPKIGPILETTSPEFSQLGYGTDRQHPLPTPTTSELVVSGLTSASNQGAIELVTNAQDSFKPQAKESRPTSGSQLYLQRLAALKGGKLYTRLPANSFESAWAKTGTAQPSHEQWKRLLQQEALSVAKGQGTNRLAILLGDSLSMWFPSERFPGGQLWLNQGISGENTGQILSRLSAFSPTRPSTIYVLGGINDLRQGASDRTILDNLRQIMRRLRSQHPQSQIIVQSILPTRLNGIPPERISPLNEQLAAIAQQEGAGYLNLYPLFADSQGYLRRELTTDGIHLTQRGYQVWQEGLNYAETALKTGK